MTSVSAAPASPPALPHANHPGSGCRYFERYETRQPTCDVICSRLGWDAPVAPTSCETCLRLGGPDSRAAEHHVFRPAVQRVLLTVSRTFPLHLPEVKRAYVYKHLSREERVARGFPAEYVPGYFNPPAPPESCAHAVGYIRRNPCGVKRMISAVPPDRQALLGEVLPEMVAAIEWAEAEQRAVEESLRGPKTGPVAVAARCANCP